MKKYLFLLFLLMVIAIPVSGCSSTDKSDPVAIVNGESISQEQLEQRYQQLKTGYEKQYPELKAGQTNGLNEKERNDFLGRIKDQAYENLILQNLLQQDAKNKGIEVSKKEIDDAVSDLKESKAIEGKDAYAKFLTDNGLDEKQLREEFNWQLLLKKMQQKEAAAGMPKEEEMKQYYDENLDMFKQAGGIQIYHILVEEEKEARDILVKLQKGADFSELAKQYSSCPSKEKGGDLGLVDENTNFVPEFKAAALVLNPEEITNEPVKTEFGYHIIKAGDRKETTTKPFAEVKNQIMLQLQEAQRSSQFNQFLENLRTKADIKEFYQKQVENQ